MRKDERIRWAWLDEPADARDGCIDVDGQMYRVRQVSDHDFRAYNSDGPAIVRAGSVKSLVRRLYYWPNSVPFDPGEPA